MSTDPTPELRRRGQALIIAVVLLGVGLVAAPGIFRMFTRAPLGGTMIREFRPFMVKQKLESFKNQIAVIDAAHSEISVGLGKELGLTPEDFRNRFPELTRFDEEWPAISADMASMLRTIKANIPNFEAVDALPPFPLFPWFFVLPGVLIVGLAASAYRDSGKNVVPAGKLWLLIGLGTAVVLAPAAFKMFERAPAGASMIGDFGSIMTSENVTQIQGYFLVLGATEGEIRTSLRPALEARGSEFEALFPKTAEFEASWPTIAADLAPMVGAMSDNLDNFAAVDALPSFDLFPWFFVIPGVLVGILAFLAEPALVEGPLGPAINKKGG